MSDKPPDRLPSDPLSDAWREVVASLAERAHAAEAWALEIRQRSEFAMRRYEDVTIMLDQLLDDPKRHQEAHAAIRVAAESIKRERAGSGETAH